MIRSHVGNLVALGPAALLAATALLLLSPSAEA